MQENGFEKDFFKLMNSADFGESMENIVREQRDIKLVTTEARRNYLVSEPNHHTAVKGMEKKKISSINIRNK